MAEFACRVTNSASRRSEASFRFDPTNSGLSHTKEGSDTDIGNVSGSIDIWRGKPQNQIITLIPCQLNVGWLEIILAIGFPSSCALRITKSKPDMTSMGFPNSHDQVVMRLNRVMVLQLEILSHLLCFLTAESTFIIGQRMFYRCWQFLGEKNDRIILIISF
ncbi:hypothetical protein AAAW81_02840 [Bifidobacterium adolescentis]|uniref:hypothetical protein n=1 Tax=Bifidobacterium adolescentis TaxID=1680 RepID=UPI0032C1CF53